MWDLSSRDSVLLPAIAGISSVLVVMAGLFWLQSSRLYTKAIAKGGTHYEVNDDGTSVRRSNRCIHIRTSANNGCSSVTSTQVEHSDAYVLQRLT